MFAVFGNRYHQSEWGAEWEAVWGAEWGVDWAPHHKLHQNFVPSQTHFGWFTFPQNRQKVMWFAANNPTVQKNNPQEKEFLWE
jgi:hypothetical protein